MTGAPVGGSTVTQVYTRCSDPNVILDCKPTQPGEPHDIFVKVCVHVCGCGYLCVMCGCVWVYVSCVYVCGCVCGYMCGVCVGGMCGWCVSVCVCIRKGG